MIAVHLFTSISLLSGAAKICEVLTISTTFLDTLTDIIVDREFGRYLDTGFICQCLILRTLEAGIPALRKLPCGVERRYTGFAQTSLSRRKPVYR